MITVLCGGVGGSRFLRALTSVVRPEEITAIINTADDHVFHGLHVSPDPDIVTYALAGAVDEERGWGLHGDTFNWNVSLERFGHETWFQIGDQDLATHLHRTRMLRDGATLSECVRSIASAFGVTVRLLPMSDDPIQTIVDTPIGPLPFQEYLVKRHASDRVTAVRFEGADAALPAPGVIEAFANADTIFIAPSNPIASIGPILAVPGIRESLLNADAPRIAISPIIAGRSLQPPAGEMLSGLGYAVDVSGVARFYAGLVDALVIDDSDATAAPGVEAHGMSAVIAPTLMRDDASRRALAVAALAAARLSPESASGKMSP